MQLYLADEHQVQSVGHSGLVDEHSGQAEEHLE